MRSKKIIMIKKLLVAVLFLSFYSTAVISQVSSPQPLCVSVLPIPLGAVTLNWTTPIDPLNQFVNYKIYRAPALAGPYALVLGGTITVYNQTTFTDNTAGANTAIKYYYIQTTYNAPGAILSPPIDTVRTIFLTAVPFPVGDATLTWNATDTPPIASSTGIYNIFMEFPAGSGNWSLTGSTTNLNFIDTIFTCNSILNYRVEIADGSGCVSVSSLGGGVAFQNAFVPSVPVLDTLSVNNNNQPILNWSANTAPDVAGYVIYEQNAAGSWITVDTVFGINNLNYTYLLGNAGLDSLRFRVAAFDSCTNISPAGNNLQTMYLTSVADICNHSATLNWTAYPSIGTGLAGYRVYQATAAAGPYVYLGTVAPGVLTFSATGLSTLTTYYFKVIAFDFSGQKKASSNRRSFYCAAPIPPNFLYCVAANVGSSNRVDITAFVDTNASVLGYKVMRATNNSPNGYTQIGMVAPTSLPIIMYSDYNADTDNKSYYYKFINVDSCGFDGMQSNIGRTMKLTAHGNSDFTNTLTWNKYQAWDGNVLSYHLYRGLNGLLETIPIKTFYPFMTDDTTYTDTVLSILKGDGNFYYQIEAVEGAGIVFNFGAISRSNIATAKQDPEMFIPNAFTPEAGVNTVFVPIATWANYANYSLDIFDRYGENLFSTKKLGEGWDGTMHGRNCETGVYVYILSYRSAKGEDIHRKGIVTLLR